MTVRTALERRENALVTRHRMRSHLETIESLQIEDAQSTADNVWVALTLLNSWVDYNASTHAVAAYMKDNEGIVHLRGMLKDGSAAAGTVLATLPVGFRPAKTVTFPIIADNAIEAVDVEADGDIVLQTVASSVYLSLSNIRFGVQA